VRRADPTVVVRDTIPSPSILWKGITGEIAASKHLLEIPVTFKPGAGEQML
jgi:hypothetical protein